MQKTVVVLQARMGSTRLPGKVLIPITGGPILQVVLRRIKRMTTIDGIVVATSTEALDDAIEAFVRDHEPDATIFRGSEKDVLKRFHGAAAQSGADVIVRATADNPLFDPPTADAVVRLREQCDCEYASNTLRPTYPLGLAVEAFKWETLQIAHKEATSPYDREHVTPYIINRPGQFDLCGLELDEDLSHLRLTVDTPEDLRRIRQLFARWGPEVTYRQVASQP